MRHLLPPVLDQGIRPTCMVFATTAVHGVAIAAANPFFSLSEEMLYWGSVTERGLVGGAYPHLVDETLQSNGNCESKLCPYEAEAIKDPPHADALADALGRKAKLIQLQNDITAIKEILARKSLVVAILPVWGSFHRAPKGLIPDPESEAMEGKHAIALTQFLDVDSFGPAFEFRNSWGREWGDDGYGFLLEDTLSKVLESAWEIEVT